MKHLTLTLGVLCLLATSLTAQVKTKFQDKDYKNRTVVIKESKEVQDMDILNSQFDINKVKVGDVIRITTGRENEVAKGTPALQLEEKSSIRTFQKQQKRKIFKKPSSSAITFKKHKKKKPVLVYSKISKRERRKGLKEKCYKF